jgi:hypothetical protein
MLLNRGDTLTYATFIEQARSFISTWEHHKLTLATFFPDDSDWANLDWSFLSLADLVGSFSSRPTTARVKIKRSVFEEVEESLEDGIVTINQRLASKVDLY